VLGLFIADRDANTEYVGPPAYIEAINCPRIMGFFSLGILTSASLFAGPERPVLLC
jgi:hypothetical protein